MSRRIQSVWSPRYQNIDKSAVVANVASSAHRWYTSMGGRKGRSSQPLRGDVAVFLQIHELFSFHRCASTASGDRPSGRGNGAIGSHLLRTRRGFVVAGIVRRSCPRSRDDAAKVGGRALMPSVGLLHVLYAGNQEHLLLCSGQRSANTRSTHSNATIRYPTIPRSHMWKRTNIATQV